MRPRAQHRHAADPCFFLPRPAAGLAGLAALVYGAEIALAARAGWERGPRLLLALLVRDAMIPFLWAGAWTRGAIVWRGNPMDIRSDGSASLGLDAAAAGGR